MLSTEGAVSSGITFGLGGMAVKMIEKTIIDFKLKDCKSSSPVGIANILQNP